MTELDAKLIPSILAIIAKLGKEVQIDVPIGSTFDPETSRVIDGGTKTFTVKVTPPEDWTDSRGGESYLGKAGRSHTSLSKGCKVNMGGGVLPFTPVKGMLIRFDDRTWKVEEIGKVYTGELVGLYTFYLRA